MANLSTNTIAGLASALSSKSGAKELDSYLGGGPSPETFGGDPTGQRDSSAAFSAALTANGHVHIPAGHNYKVSSTVSLSAGQSITGDGENSLVTMASGMTTAAFAGHARTVFNGFKITGPGYATAGSRGIQIIGTGGADFRSRWKIQNVSVTECADAVYLDYCGVGDIISLFVTVCGNGVHAAGTYVNVINMFGGEIHSCTNGVLLETDPGNVFGFWGVTIEGNSAYGILMDNSVNGLRNVSVKGCYFESNITADIRSTSDNLLTNLTVEDNYHLNFATAVLLDKCQLGRIVNNSFQVSSFVAQKAITLGASCRWVRVGANRYQPTGSLYYSPPTDDTGFGNTLDQRPDGFYATGDGTTDDTAALQAWLTANPVHAHLPAGTYLVTGKLTLATDQLLTGEGMNKSIIKADAAYAGVVLEMNVRSEARDIGIQGADTASSIGVQAASNSIQWHLTRVQIRDMDSGVKIDNANHDVSIVGCMIRLCATNGILISSGSGNAERLTIDNCIFDTNPRHILASGAAYALNILNSTFKNATTYAVEITGQVRGGTITGNRFENNGTADLRIAGTSRCFHIAGNRFKTTTTSVLWVLLNQSYFGQNMLEPGTTTITYTAGLNNEFGHNHAQAGTYDGAALVSGNQNTYLGRYYGTAAPGSGTWKVGDTVWDITPVSAAAVFWTCSVAGTPGTWLTGPNYA